MKCTACGNENQPGAKFCVHCGVVLSEASAPSTAAATPKPATATAAAPAPAPRPAPPAPAPSVAPAAVATASAQAAPAATAPAPAAALASSPRMGLIIGAIAVLIVLGVGGYFGYRLLGGPSKEAVVAVETPKPETAVAPAPASDSSTAPATQETTSPGGAATASTPSGAAAQPPVPAEGAQAAIPTATGAPPASPPVATDMTKVEPAAEKGTRLKAQKAVPPATDTTSKAAGQPAAASPTSKALAKAPAAAPAAAPDRWQMFADAMAQCQHLDFFSRIGCEQRERWHYCDGYWNKVPQCPSANYSEHGS